MVVDPVLLLAALKFVRLGLDAMKLSDIDTLEKAQAELEKAAVIHDQGVADWKASKSP